MRILFCCQFYAPSVGGVQEVIRQLAERFVARGHQVTVATTTLPARDFDTLNGVDIQGFDVKGNRVSGMTGEVREYQEYVQRGDFDVVMIYAAQQWTFDALWPVLDNIKYAKVFGPCGFSGLYESGYAKYYQDLPEVLRKFDHLIFNATKYRDIDYVRDLGIGGFSILSNGANEVEFDVVPDPTFRVRHGIPLQSFLFLTVGSFTGLKGHHELVNAFARMHLPENQHATLILNGNEVQSLEKGLGDISRKFVGLVKTHGLIYSLKQAVRRMIGSSSSPRTVAESINKLQSNKLVLVTDLPRKELTQAFIAADLFVFASNIEHSPLVLFEAAAAGTPFLSVYVGNAEEIARWTGAGVMCPSEVDAKGYTRVNEGVLAQTMASLMKQNDLLETMGVTGKKNWQERFTWGKVAGQYEEIFTRLVNSRA
ncbi:MAG: glycosyltransferase family 4 protein [Gallionella sp.]|nr:glycosyltransferase family 4 protein [Gallionella sp.]